MEAEIYFQVKIQHNKLNSKIINSETRSFIYTRARNELSKNNSKMNNVFGNLGKNAGCDSLTINKIIIDKNKIFSCFKSHMKAMRKGKSIYCQELREEYYVISVTVLFGWSLLEACYDK